MIILVFGMISSYLKVYQSKEIKERKKKTCIKNIHAKRGGYPCKEKDAYICTLLLCRQHIYIIHIEKKQDVDQNIEYLVFIGGKINEWLIRFKQGHGIKFVTQKK